MTIKLVTQRYFQCLALLGALSNILWSVPLQASGPNDDKIARWADQSTSETREVELRIVRSKAQETLDSAKRRQSEAQTELATSSTRLAELQRRLKTPKKSIKFAFEIQASEKEIRILEGKVAYLKKVIRDQEDAIRQSTEILADTEVHLRITVAPAVEALKAQARELPEVRRALGDDPNRLDLGLLQQGIDELGFKAALLLNEIEAIQSGKLAEIPQEFRRTQSDVLRELVLTYVGALFLSGDATRTYFDQKPGTFYFGAATGIGMVGVEIILSAYLRFAGQGEVAHAIGGIGFGSMAAAALGYGSARIAQESRSDLVTLPMGLVAVISGICSIPSVLFVGGPLMAVKESADKVGFVRRFENWRGARLLKRFFKKMNDQLHADGASDAEAQLMRALTQAMTNLDQVQAVDSGCSESLSASALTLPANRE